MNENSDNSVAGRIDLKQVKEIYKIVVSLQFVTLYGTAMLVAEEYNLGLHCWISHSRRILNGIHVAMAYNITNCKLTTYPIPTHIKHTLS